MQKSRFKVCGYSRSVSVLKYFEHTIWWRDVLFVTGEKTKGLPLATNEIEVKNVAKQAILRDFIDQNKIYLQLIPSHFTARSTQNLSTSIGFRAPGENQKKIGCVRAEKSTIEVGCVYLQIQRLPSMCPSINQGASYFNPPYLPFPWEQRLRIFTQSRFSL